jgi:PST family polysaccharide transporter
MNLRQKAVKGVVWSVIQSWGSQAVSFIVFFLLARLLEPKTFGLVAMASVFLAFIQLFLDQGFSVALIQRHKIEPEHLDTAFWTNIGIGALLTLFGIASAGLVADFFKQPELTAIIRWLSLSFLLSGLSAVPQAIFSRNLAFKPLAIRSLVAVLAGGLVGVAMALTNFGVWALVGQQLVNSLVQVIVLWWASDWRPGFQISKKHFQELFFYGINVVGIGILNFFNRRGDDLLIGYFLGPVALGYYSIAYRLLLIMTQLLTGVTSQVAMPTFSRLQQDLEQLRSGYYMATQLTSFMAFPAFFGIAVLAPILVPFLFGPQWLASIPVIQILVFIGVLHSVEYLTSTVIMAVGKPLWRLGLNSLNGVTNIIGFAIAVRWGIAAVAASYVIRGYLLSPLPLLAVKKLIHIDLKIYFQQLVAPIVGSLALVVAILIAQHFLSDLINLYGLLAVCLIVGTLAYMITILLIVPTLFQQVLNLAKLALPTRTGKF